MPVAAVVPLARGGSTPSSRMASTCRLRASRSSLRLKRSVDSAMGAAQSAASVAHISGERSRLSTTCVGSGLPPSTTAPPPPTPPPLPPPPPPPIDDDDDGGGGGWARSSSAASDGTSSNGLDRISCNR